MNPTLSISALLLLPASLLLAKSPPESPSKWGYHLFNPTPKELMREMSTDRPDKTESPYTVDAGHFQLEASVVDITKTDSQGTDLFGLNAGNLNLKVGLLNNVDLQVVLENYVYQKVKSSGFKSTESGFGDVTTRSKVNLWGNDGGPTAFAIMPFLKIPTGTTDLSNGNLEGGVILPLAVELPYDWGMGVMTEFDFYRSPFSGYETAFVNTITFGRPIIGNLSGYVEFFSAVSSEDSTEWVGTIDTGLTYAISDDIQLDAGCNFGVTESADDFNPFVGFSVRY